MHFDIVLKSYSVLNTMRSNLFLGMYTNSGEYVTCIINRHDTNLVVDTIVNDSPLPYMSGLYCHPRRKCAKDPLSHLFFKYTFEINIPLGQTYSLHIACTAVNRLTNRYRIRHSIFYWRTSLWIRYRNRCDSHQDTSPSPRHRNHHHSVHTDWHSSHRTNQDHSLEHSKLSQ